MRAAFDGPWVAFKGRGTRIATQHGALTERVVLLEMQVLHVLFQREGHALRGKEQDERLWEKDDGHGGHTERAHHSRKDADESHEACRSAGSGHTCPLLMSCGW